MYSHLQLSLTIYKSLLQINPYQSNNSIRIVDTHDQFNDDTSETKSDQYNDDNSSFEKKRF